MQKLWIAYWFSLHQARSPVDLGDYFALSVAIDDGYQYLDSHLSEISLAWRQSVLVFPQSKDPQSFQKFCDTIHRAEEQGIRFTHPSLDDFPVALLQLQEIPFFLSYLGEPVWLQKPGLAVVGSREPAALACAWAELELPSLLKQLPLFIASGGARGVDQLAHRICLRLQKPTVAFLPSGLNDIYPTDFKHWVAPILASGGAVVSEFFPSVPMRKHHFQQRNRLIAGISVATLAVEARRRSGTLLTARQTIEQGRPLFVLPSHPLDTANLGALDLLFEGATPVRDAQDLVIYLSAELPKYSLPKSGLVDREATKPYI